MNGWGWLAMVMSVAFLAAWLTVGHIMARRRLPAIWDAARRKYTFAEGQRGYVRDRVTGVILAGPVAALATLYSAMIDNGDPVLTQRKRAERELEHEREIAAQRRRVADLERELGISHRTETDR